MPAPAVSPFTAFGVGNGFPTCFGKLDVSGYDAYNPMTLQQLCKLYWLLWGINGESSATGGSETIEVLDVNLDDDYTGSIDYEPVDRVCNTSTITASESLFNGLYTLEAAMNLYTKSRMARLYDGSTDDEDNFIGYGITRRLTFNTAFIDAGTGIGRVEIELLSYGDADASSFIQVQDVTVSDIPFVARIMADQDGSLGTIGSGVASGSVTVGGYTASVSISDLEFYTTT